MSGGVLVRVVFVQMVFVRGGFCPTLMIQQGILNLEFNLNIVIHSRVTVKIHRIMGYVVLEEKKKDREKPQKVD